MKKCIMMVIAAAVFLPGLMAQTLPPVAKQVVISGTVIDDTYPMKRPIANVMVRLWIWDVIETFVWTPNPVVQVVLLDSTTTGALGTFAFKPVTAGPYSGGKYMVSFDNPSFVSRQISVYAQADTSLTVFMLASGAKARVAGTVWAWCSGLLGMPCILQPIPGCTVTVSTVSALWTDRITINPVIAITDSQGNYAIDSIPVVVNGERVSVSAGAAGYTAQTLDTTIRDNVTTTVNFSLAKTTVGHRDTAFVTPQHPTASDSLHFTLYNAYHCCATIYRGNSVSVSDTIIYLSYTYDDTMCPYISLNGSCFNAGSETNFSSKPLPAGRYAIYKVESIYCPLGRVCPLFLLAPERVGTVTVSSAASVRPTTGDKALLRGNCLTVAGTSISATIARSARVTLRAYDVRGALIGEAFNGRLPAGTRHFNMGEVFTKATARGTVLLVLTVDGIAIADKTIIISR
jgi:hypothetical protein